MFRGTFSIIIVTLTVLDLSSVFDALGVRLGSISRD